LTRIIAVSETSKRDIVELYDVPAEKVSVVYNGFNQNVFNSEAAPVEAQTRVLERLGIKRPFILHHGTVQPRKNLIRLIAAYHRLVEKFQGLNLVLVGNLGWEFKPILDFASKNSARGNVLFTGPLPETELGLVVKAAQLVVMPSLYEGFCLPMIEAMACGIPTVASRTSCLP
jgi:glycosyltransferase involved in cell wall biosynthesis